MKFPNHIYFYPEKPVLVHRDQDLVEMFCTDPDWVAELKYNGVRCVLTIINGEVSFWTRHGAPIKTIDLTDDRCKELVKEVTDAVPSTGHYQFEGELRHKKVTGLQYRLVLWDCLIYNDEYLNKLTYDERRELVLKHFSVAPDAQDKVINLSEYKRRITVIHQFPDDFRRVFIEFADRQAGNTGLYKYNSMRHLIESDEFEGLVFKNRNGKLNLGRNTNPDSKWMMKIRIETGRHKF